MVGVSGVLFLIGAFMIGSWRMWFFSHRGFNPMSVEVSRPTEDCLEWSYTEDKKLYTGGSPDMPKEEEWKLNHPHKTSN